MTVAVLDAGPLYAAVDAADVDHARCVSVLERPDLQLVVPALALAEAAYFVERRLGPRVEAAFIRGLSALEVEGPLAEEWEAIAALVERYADFPLGTTDASVAVLADRLGTDLIVTLDRRHFSAIRSPEGHAYRLLPD